MKKTHKKNKGITLVVLVVTIILLLILAGISIASLTNSGLFEKARLAEQKSKNAQELEDITLKDYENKIGEYVGGNRQDISSSQPTGIKTDAYIKNSITSTTTYNVTTMSGLTRETDSENKIDEYLSYSDESGYTVLKGGWYFVNMEVTMSTASASADVIMRFYINDQVISSCNGWAELNNRVARNENSFPIYLSQGDEIYFNAGANMNVSARTATATCYPMF